MIHSSEQGFTLIELIIVIAILAILASIAVPAYSGYVESTLDAEAMVNAKNAYTQYFLDHYDSGTSYFIYEQDAQRFVAIRQGSVINEVFSTQEMAKKALTDLPDTVVDESLSYDVISTSVTNLWAVRLSDGTVSDGSQWSNATAVFVGDSITYGSGTTKAYHAYLTEMMGLRNAINMGIAGSCVSARSDYGNGNTPLINRYQQIPSADLIFIFIGTNDYGHDTPLGNPNDTGDISFYGALNEIIGGVVASHPNSRIVMATPLHRYGVGTSKITGKPHTYDYLPNGRGHTLADYANAIKTVCGKWSVPVIDLFSLCSIDPSQASQKSAYMPDGIHPNAAGHEIVAGILAEHLKVIPNPNYVTDTPNQPNTVTMRFGNKFASSQANSTTRASSSTNIYLTEGQTVTLLDPSAFQWAMAGTSNEYSDNRAHGYYPAPQWSDIPSYTVTTSGYYGFTFMKKDGTVFNFADGLDSNDLYDYIVIH